MSITVIVICVAALLIGAAVGWVIRGVTSAGTAGPPEVRTVEKIVERIVEKMPDDISQQREQASVLFKQLEGLTAGVNAQIGEHTKKVGSINAELTSAADGGGNVVDAIRKLIESNNAMQNKLQDAQVRIKEQQSAMARQAEEARTDALTKLRNRRALDDELRKLHNEFNAKGTTAVIMMIDVDHFKKFNDSHGHLAGDEVLRSVGRVLAEKTGGKKGLFPARYGGEEFSLLFTGYTLETAAHLADRVRAAIGETPVAFEGKSLQVNASAGISQLQPGETIESFIARADEALYAAKKAGRNNAHVHENGEIRKVTKTTAPVVQDIPEVDDGNDFKKSLTRRIAEWKRGGAPVAVMTCRIDNLAAYESLFGSEAAEKALATVGDFVKCSLREMDQTAVCAAETFGVLMPAARLIDAARSAERLRMRVEAGELEAVLGSALSLSFGVAEVTPEDTGENLVMRARRALETAKAKGGNVVYLHDGHRSDAVRSRLDLADEKNSDLALSAR